MSQIVAMARREFVWFSQHPVTAALLIVLPIVLTLLLINAQQTSAAPQRVMIRDEDNSAVSSEFIEWLKTRENLRFEMTTDVMPAGASTALLSIPDGWGTGLTDGEPLALKLTINAVHPDSAQKTFHNIQELLRAFQQERLDQIIENLPDDVIELAKQLPVSNRKLFVSWMTPWTVEPEYLYNASLRNIDYAIPGIIGLVTQFFVVLLISSGISRERETGAWAGLTQQARRSSIVLGKALAHSAFWFVVMMLITAVAYGMSPAVVQRPFAIVLPSIAFAIATTGAGALAGAISRNQVQAISLALLYLLPGIVGAGVFTPVSQLPSGLQLLAPVLPLTWFAASFRDLTMLVPHFPNITGDIVIMLAIATLAFAIAILLLPPGESAVRKSS
jgi:ABC-2 type transport system permease protein